MGIENPFKKPIPPQEETPKPEEKQEHIFNSEEHTMNAMRRALQLLEQGEFKQAVISMLSDLYKDPTKSEDEKSMTKRIGTVLILDPELNEQKVREFIEGFPEVGMLAREGERPKGRELTEEDLKSSEEFISRFILGNKELSPAGKELVQYKAMTERGPWNAKDRDHIKKVTQDGNKITIYTKSGENYLYIR